MCALNETQIAYWNTSVGERWARRHTEIDEMLAPFSEALLGAADFARGPKRRVLDIGCGSGTTSLAAAGLDHEVIGLDVSAPLLDLAKKRAQAQSPGLSNPSFFKADASTTFMDPPFDQMISRFGVMFFADPIAAFKNLKRLLLPGGRLTFVCWRNPEANAWVNVPLHALQGMVELPIPSNPAPGGLDDAVEPGPFAFSDERRLRRVLTAAGFKNLVVTPMDAPMIMGGNGVEEAAAYVAEIGPAARAIGELPAERQPLAIERLRAGLLPHMQGRKLVLEGAIWIVEAVA